MDTSSLLAQYGGPATGYLAFFAFVAWGFRAVVKGALVPKRVVDALEKAARDREAVWKAIADTQIARSELREKEAAVKDAQMSKLIEHAEVSVSILRVLRDAADKRSV